MSPPLATSSRLLRVLHRLALSCALACLAGQMVAAPAQPAGETSGRERIRLDDAWRFATDKRQFARFVTDTSVLPKLDLAPG